MRLRIAARRARRLLAAARRYVRLPRQERALANEALFELARAVVHVRVLGWNHYARRLGPPGHGDAEVRDHQDLVVPQRVAIAIERWRRMAPDALTCLVRAVAGQRMLARRGVGSAVVLGVRFDDSVAGLAAHGWLRVGARTVIGADGGDRYRAIAHYVALGRSEPRGS